MNAAKTLIPLLVVWLPAQTQFELRTPGTITVAWPHEAVAGDFDGDGDLDLFGWSSLLAGQPARRLLRNDGDERFTDVSAASLPTAPTPPFGSGRAVAFDADGDRDLDLLSCSVGTASLWRNLGNGTFVDTGFTDSGGYTGLCAADLDGDGDLDVAGAGNPLAASTTTLFVNQGGTLQRQNALPTLLASAIAAVDLDGDGDQDVLLGGLNGVVVARNDGNLVFTDATAAWVGGALPGTVRDLAVGDLDGDGDPDVVVARAATPDDGVLRNTGTAFVVGALIPTVANGTNRLRLADVDGDGALDLWRAAAGLTLAFGDGRGAFTPAANRAPALPTQVPGLVAADFDRDGDADLLIGEVFWPPSLLVNRHRDLRPDQPLLGQAWQPEVWSQPGYATFAHGVVLGIALAALRQPVAIAGLGEVALDPNGPLLLAPGVVTPNGTPARFPFPIPNAPLLAGVTLHVQAIVDQAPAHVIAWFTVAIR